MTSPELILVTGANGYIGFAVTIKALKSGYRVRAVVRRQDAVDLISNHPSSTSYVTSGALSFAIVTDNTQPQAYREATQGCSYIIHTASPLPTVPGDLVTPALAGTRAILHAALATPFLKRVIFTASTSSLRPFERLLPNHPDNLAMMSGRADEVMTITADTKNPTQMPLPDSAPGFHQYVNSKTAAANLVHAFAESKQFEMASFSIVNIMPGYVLGPEDLVNNKRIAFKRSNLILSMLFAPLKLNALFGISEDEEAPVLAEAVHLEDVTEGHVNALDVEKVPGKYRNFLLCSDCPNGPTWNDAASIVRRRLSKEVEQGLIPFAGQLGSIPTKMNAKKAERDLLFHPFRPYEEQVVDTVKWYLSLPD